MTFLTQWASFPACYCEHSCFGIPLDKTELSTFFDCPRPSITNIFIDAREVRLIVKIGLNTVD